MLFSIGLMALSCLLIVGLHCIYLQPIQQRSRQSHDMLKIVPSWVIDRSEAAKALLWEKEKKR